MARHQAEQVVAAALRRFGAEDGDALEQILQLKAAYGEAGRSYHNWNHIKDKIGWTTRLCDLDKIEENSIDFAQLILADVWHDYVYDTRRPDNEELSAAAFDKASHTFSPVLRAQATEVSRLIFLTKTHNCDPRDRLGRILIDSDLAILFADSDKYFKYAFAIREEYSWVEEAVYVEGRCKVLQHLLDRRPAAYHSDILDDNRYRDNLRSEIDALRTHGTSGLMARR